jgi:hypothetical protein
VVVSRGNDLFLSPPHHQKSYVALHGTTYGTADVYQCTCSYKPKRGGGVGGGFTTAYSAIN